MASQDDLLFDRKLLLLLHELEDLKGNIVHGQKKYTISEIAEVSHSIFCIYKTFLGLRKRGEKSPIFEGLAFVQSTALFYIV